MLFPALSNNPENLTGPSDTALQQPNVAKVIDSILGDSRGKNNVFPPAAGGSAAGEQAEPTALSFAALSARVSVLVPASYFKSLWQRNNPIEPGHAEKTPTQAEIDNIRVEESANIQRCIAAAASSAKKRSRCGGTGPVTTFPDNPGKNRRRPNSVGSH